MNTFLLRAGLEMDSVHARVLSLQMTLVGCIRQWNYLLQDGCCWSSHSFRIT